MTGSLGPVIVGAVITAPVAVLVAVPTQIGLWRQDAARRGYERRRSALLDVQDACLDLRESLRQYGTTLRSSVDKLDAGDVVALGVAPEIFARVEMARGRLNMVIARVESNVVVQAVETWETSASQSFISDDDVSAGEEDASWKDREPCRWKGTSSLNASGRCCFDGHASAEVEA